MFKNPDFTKIAFQEASRAESRAAWEQRVLKETGMSVSELCTRTMEQIDINPDGTTDESVENSWAILKKVEGTLIQRINALLDTDDASEIFRVRNAFSAIGGRFFVEHVIDAIGKVITAYMAEEAELTRKRISQYTDDVDSEVNTDAGTTA